MPRVQLKTKNKGGTKTYSCSTCSKPILAGTRYYTWARRFGRTGRRYYQHEKPCGYPRPTQLSSSKMAVIWEAQAEAHDGIGAWKPELGDHDTSDLESVLSTLADIAREVGGEYEQSADAIEDNFPGAPTAEACREAYEACETYADALEGWSPQESEPDVDEDAPEEERQEKHDAWAEAVRDEARGVVDDDVPSYNG